MASTTTSLIGPPEIYRAQPKPKCTVPPLSSTYISFGNNPCLNFFFHVVPDTPPEDITRRLKQSWEHDPFKTLKLICNLRTGKSDKEGYYASALWLHKNHPKTLAFNLASMAEFGHFKDLPEILYRLLEGGDVRKLIAKEEHTKRLEHRLRKCRKAHVCEGGAKKNVPREKDFMKELRRVDFEKENASNNRKKKRITMAKKAIERYNRDPDFKFLHDRVSDVFAELMRSDIKFLTEGKLAKISLAAKWCPSLDSSFDKSTLLCESIAKKVFPREEYPEYKDVEEAHYAYRIRDRLRKEVLVPLRKALELPEVYIKWSLIPDDRVASVAMKLYKEKFLKHDYYGFDQYLDNVKWGKGKMVAGALLPHEILFCVEDDEDDDAGRQVAELQWKRMVDGHTVKKGKLNNCLAVCKRMCGIPLDVSVALGVLVSELSENPWKGKVITFSKNPKLQIIEGDDLRSKMKFVRRMEWGWSTDFQKVFDLILQVASDGKLSESDMIKRVFVFSNEEFDQASKNPWETDYQVIKRKFTEKGYGGAVPELVFWNLEDLQGSLVVGKEKGLVLVNGFSKNLMTLFMEDGGSLNPEGVMDSAISGEEYNKLVVVD